MKTEKRAAKRAAAMAYGLWQCFWGFPQTLLGALFFLYFWNCPHKWFRGVLHTSWNRPDGISLGLFVFTPQGEEQETRRLLLHEYGHTVQSALLGPLYLAVIGLPSLVWAAYPGFRKMRKEKGISYYSFFTERWADRLGEWVKI